MSKPETQKTEKIEAGRDSLGDRMKANYEDRYRRHLLRRTPAIIRVDGRAFHTYTRGYDTFDKRIINAMTNAAAVVAEDAQGFKLGYVQSDEASFFLTDYDTLDTAAWFDYNQSKMESISASVMTAAFNDAMGDVSKTAHFDARAFSIPKEEVANYFLWRAKDWERNSISMYCRSMFSHKQMHGQGKADQLDMLKSADRPWEALKDIEKNGTWLFRAGEGTICVRNDLRPNWADIDAFITSLTERPAHDPRTSSGD